MDKIQYVPSFYFYKFAEGISAPYTSLTAYSSGAIDSRGNIIKPESSIDPLEYLIIKLKKIFEELPQGMTKSKLGNFMTTLQLFGEEAEKFGITTSEYSGLMEATLALQVSPDLSYFELTEDMDAGGMGTPATSPGYNNGSVSGYDPVMGTTRRKEPVIAGLDNCEMFDVCPEEFKHFSSAKAWSHVPNELPSKSYLQRMQRSNPTKKYILRSVNPDTNETNYHWIQYNPKSFMEEYNLEFE